MGLGKGYRVGYGEVGYGLGNNKFILFPCLDVRD